MVKLHRITGGEDQRGKENIPEQGTKDDVGSADETVASTKGETNTAITEQLEATALEQLTDVEKACLEAMREDFNRGIVLIDDNADEGMYKAALDKDRTAGTTWETIQGRLLANNASLLKRAVGMSKFTGAPDGTGVLLVGVYQSGELAIRQKSREIVNARWTKDWEKKEDNKGELRLLYHPDAIAQETGRWARPGEIVRAVKEAGYYIPEEPKPGPNVINNKKKGLIAASEAVTGPNTYLSESNYYGRSAVFYEPPDKERDDTIDNYEKTMKNTELYKHLKPKVTVIDCDVVVKTTAIVKIDANTRDKGCGAVLWLKG